MTMHVGVSGAWKQVEKIWVGLVSAWKRLDKAWVGVGGTWKQFYSASLPAVTGLTVTGVTSASISLAWSALSGADGYSVERSNNGSTGWSEVATTASTTWSDSLSDGVKRYYRVRGYISGSPNIYGGYSSTVHDVTTLKAPVLTAASGNYTSVNLVLSDGGSASESQIRAYISTTGPSSGFIRASTLGGSGDPIAANATNAVISGLQEGNGYWIKLRNYNAVAGESADSAVKSFTTPVAAPGDVTDLHVTAYDCNSVSLAWSDVSGETEYRIYKYQGGLPTLHDTIAAGSTSYFVDSGLSVGETWHFEVRPYKTGYGEGDSNAVRQTLLNAPTAPTAISSEEPGADNTMGVSWSGASGATGYDLDYSINGGSSWDDVDTPSSSPYDWTGWVTPLGTPSGLTVISHGYDRVKLGWTNASLGDTMDTICIDRKVSAGSWVEDFYTTGSAINQWEDVTCDPETEYSYRVRYKTFASSEHYDFRVRATNACGNSSFIYTSSSLQPHEAGAYTSTVSQTTDAQIPYAPSGLTADDIPSPPPPADGAVHIEWTNNDTYDSIKIQRSPGGAGTFSTIDTTTGTDVDYDDLTTASGTSYDYRVIGHSNTYGDSNPSNVAGVTTS